MSVYITLKISREKALELYFSIQKIPTNKELEEFIEDYCLKEKFYNCLVSEYHKHKNDDSLVESFFLDKKNEIEKEEEETEPFTFSFLKRKLGWTLFCELTGTNEYCINEGFAIRDSDIFYLKKSDVEKYGL